MALTKAKRTGLKPAAEFQAEFRCFVGAIARNNIAMALAVYYLGIRICIVSKWYFLYWLDNIQEIIVLWLREATSNR